MSQTADQREHNAQGEYTITTNHMFTPSGHPVRFILIAPRRGSSLLSTSAQPPFIPRVLGSDCCYYTVLYFQTYIYGINPSMVKKVALGVKD